MDKHRQTRRTRMKPSSDGSDVQLLSRVKRGDREAFRELYGIYYDPLLHFMRRLTGQLELAEEGVNDVMLVVWNNGEGFTGRSRVSTWIMGIAYHKALKLLEQSRRWSTRFKAVDLDDWVEHSEVPVERGENGDLRDLRKRALARLSPEHRAVVELTYFSGCSYQEIAAIAACPVNTVKTRMFHASAKLRELLPSLAENERFA